MAKEYESGSIRRTTIVPPRIIEPSKREWKIGERIANRYQIFKIIEGGMGVLYFCYDREAKEPVAIKTFKERGILDLNIIELFRSEALTWVRLGKHKNIVQAKYVVDIGKKTYIFLEYIVSETEPTLRTLLRKGRLELDYTLNLAIQFCDGMIYATKVIPGLIHRDIKPENILVTQDGVLKITDFGLTKVFFDLSTEIGSIVGTIPYMSPEQCLGLKVFDIRSDIYSFGIVIYEMLAGRHPFNATSKLEFLYHHIVTNPTEVKVLNPSLSRDINDIVMKCLRKKPEERFQNFTELKKTLLNFYSGKIIESFGTEIPSSRLVLSRLKLY
ncbi:MAG: serine/threonine protein kinase [Candidatus Scalindua rubra]|uniref:Serine/threonine protein kinase n=1 Tax=Candidatus Scalindua rubra TaxID=1872076 RepID=A0A1E3X8U4_9BACT|nr:MAG: serine/threonine protein kinase [Candidatus Scalindua rubra]